MSEAHHGMDWFLLGASFVNFATLLAVLYFVLRKPLKAFLVARRQAVAGELESAAAVRADAELELKQHAERLRNMDQELAHLRQEMMHAGQAERERMLHEAEQKVARMRTDVTFTVEQHVKQLRINILREVAARATRQARTILAKEVKADDHQRLAQQFLDGLKRHAEESVRPAPAKRVSEERSWLS